MSLRHDGPMIKLMSDRSHFSSRGAPWRWFALGALLWPLGVVLTCAEYHYLFTSFCGNGEDGLHLALSTNGYHWTDLKSDGSFLRPGIGGKLMRGPCLAQGPDRQFHLVWTTGRTAESGKVLGTPLPGTWCIGAHNAASKSCRTSPGLRGCPIGRPEKLAGLFEADAVPRRP